MEGGREAGEGAGVQNGGGSCYGGGGRGEGGSEGEGGRGEGGLCWRACTYEPFVSIPCTMGHRYMTRAFYKTFPRERNRTKSTPFDPGRTGVARIRVFPA